METAHIEIPTSNSLFHCANLTMSHKRESQRRNKSIIEKQTRCSYHYVPLILHPHPLAIHAIDLAIITLDIVASSNNGNITKPFQVTKEPSSFLLPPDNR